MNPSFGVSRAQAARQTLLQNVPDGCQGKRQDGKKVGPAFGKPELTQGVQRRLDDEDRKRVNHQGAATKADAVYMRASEQISLIRFFLDLRAGPYMHCNFVSNC